MSKYDLAVRTIQDGSQLRQARGFFLSNPGVYDPQTHIDWQLTTNLPGIENGERPTIGVWEDGEVHGASVLKLGLDAAELKYFRHDGPPDYMGIGVGNLLMGATLRGLGQHLAEAGMLTPDATAITVSLDTADPAAERFFSRYGFRVVDRVDLYGSGRPDALMRKKVPLL